MALKLHQFEEEVGEIVTRAQKEEKMEVILQKMDDFWSKLEFESYPYKESELQLVRISEEEFETLEEHQVRCMPGCIRMTGGTLFDRTSLYDRCTFKI
jgi:dynein heavy chain